MHEGAQYGDACFRTPCAQCGYTALMLAGSDGHDEVVQALLVAGSNKEAEDKVGAWGSIVCKSVFIMTLLACSYGADRTDSPQTCHRERVLRSGAGLAGGRRRQGGQDHGGTDGKARSWGKGGHSG